MFLLWLKNKSDDSLAAYCEIKAKAKRLIKAAKVEEWKKFGEELEDAGQNRNKKFWSTIKNIRRAGIKESCTSVLDKEGQLVTARWKGYFQELFKSMNEVIEPTEVGEPRVSDEEEDDVEFSIDDVPLKIRKLEVGKTAGADEIRPEFIKNSGMAGILWLHRIFNLALSSKAVPRNWRYAILAPIFKKGNRKDCKNYRGISLLNVVGKIYASILMDLVGSIVYRILVVSGL